jgi:regulator of sigma E protease
VFNFILSILIFASVLMIAGRPGEQPIVGTPTPLPADMATLEAGDLITAIDGTPIETLADVFIVARELPPAETVTYGLERDGRMVERRGVVSAVAHRAVGLAAIGRDGCGPCRGRPDPRGRRHAGPCLFATARGGGRLAGTPLALSVWRDGEMLDITLSPRRTDLPLPEGGFETRWLIGITGGLIFDPETVRVGPLDAVWSGVEQTGFIIRSSLVGALAHDHRRDFVVQPARAHRHRRDQRRHGQPGDRRVHLVHRGPVDGGRAAEPVPDPGAGRGPSAVSRL